LIGGNTIKMFSIPLLPYVPCANDYILQEERPPPRIGSHCNSLT
jgi:hypothetical protein